MSAVIKSFFTKSGIPAIGLTPTIRIWEVNGVTDDIIIGSPNGTGDPGSGIGTDGIMAEVIDSVGGISQDGFYKFEFTPAMGYDPTKSYITRIDGGSSLLPSDRYQVGDFDPTDEATVQNITDGIYDEPRNLHLIPGSMGEAINLNRADISAIRTNDLPVLLDLIDLVRKYQTNRTKIDPVANTLTVYDDDCVTVLRVFHLLDSAGNPDVSNVCERDPTSALNTAANSGSGATDTSSTCP